MEKQLLDYSSPVFKFPYEMDGSKYYATFHPELLKAGDGHLQITGRYFVVALTPEGLFHFHIIRDQSGNWFSHNASASIDSDLIQWCGERIEARGELLSI